MFSANFDNANFTMPRGADEQFLHFLLSPITVEIEPCGHAWATISTSYIGNFYAERRGAGENSFFLRTPFLRDVVTIT